MDGSSVVVDWDAVVVARWLVVVNLESVVVGVVKVDVVTVC